MGSQDETGAGHRPVNFSPYIPQWYSIVYLHISKIPPILAPMIKISKIKMFRSTVNPSICYVHTTSEVVPGKTIRLGDETAQVKRIVSSQQSKHWADHTFYELRV